MSSLVLQAAQKITYITGAVRLTLSRFNEVLTRIRGSSRDDIPLNQYDVAIS